MRATKTNRGSARRGRPVKRNSKRIVKRAAVKAAVKPALKPKLIAPPEPVLYKLCKPGWAVIV